MFLSSPNFHLALLRKFFSVIHNSSLTWKCARYNVEPFGLDCIFLTRSSVVDPFKPTAVVCSFFSSLSLSSPPNERSWMNVSACIRARVAFGGKPAIIRRCTRERWYRFVACTRTCAEPRWKDKGTSLSNGTLLFPSASPSWKKERKEGKKQSGLFWPLNRTPREPILHPEKFRDSDQLDASMKSDIPFRSDINGILSGRKFHEKKRKRISENNWMALEGDSKEMYIWDRRTRFDYSPRGVISRRFKSVAKRIDKSFG